MRRPRSLLLVLGVLSLAAGAAAQPKPAPAPEKPSEGKLDAKALMASGLRLLRAKDYLGALVVFKDAYARFPSARLLLNIGTTLRLLERSADAANAYQRYLDAPDSDPAKRGEVARVVGLLDKKVGHLELSVTPADAEVRINDEDWQPAAQVARYRVEPGPVSVSARKDRFQPGAASAQLAAGEKAALAIALVAVPEPARPVVPAAVPPGGEAGPGIRAGASAPAPRSRLGVLAMARVDVSNRGGAALLGLTVDVLSRLQLQGAAIVGPFYGGYGGASLAILRGVVRPTISAGVTIFSSDGPRYALRGAGGLELQLGRHVSLIAELGVDYVLNEQVTETLDIKKVLFVPAVGASGRL
jgi:tetratricopeptide (TPR) repeat protein